MSPWKMRASDVPHTLRYQILEELTTMSPRREDSQEEITPLPGSGDWQRFMWAEIKEMRRSQVRFEKEVNDKLDKLHERLGNLKVEIAVQKTKTAIIGAVGGFVAAIAAQIGINWSRR